MIIATYVDHNGMITSPYSDGYLRLYNNSSGIWTFVKDITFTIRPEMKLLDVKAAVRKAALEMEGCNIFLSAETRGLVHALLQEELGFHTWKSQGPLLDQLDAVAAKEAELATTPPPIVPLESKTSGRTGCCGSRRETTTTPCDSAPLPSLERVADGHYRINLIAELQRDQALNSRMALIPILEGQAFEKLEILCDHVPRWFSSALIELNLRAESQVTEQGVNVLVFPNH